MFISYLKKVLHDRTFLFWSIMFPICLMACFKVAFSNLYDDYKFFDPSEAVYVNACDTGLGDIIMDNLEMLGIPEAYEMFHFDEVAELVENGDYEAFEEFEFDDEAFVQYLMINLQNMEVMEMDFSVSGDTQEKIKALMYALSFEQTLKNLSDEGDNQCFNLCEAESIEEGEKLLESGEKHVLFIIENGRARVELAENYSSVDLLVVNSFMTSFDSQFELAMESIDLENMFTEADAGFDLMSLISSGNEDITSKTYITALENIYGEEPDPYNWYYYATFGMAIMFNIISGVSLVGDVQANITKSALRVSISATSKMKILISAFMARFVVVLGFEAVHVLVMRYIFKIPMGNRLGLLIIFLIVANLFTLSIGETLGIFIKGNLAKKENTANALLMTSVFLSGEMIATLPGMFATSCPIINEVNPATIINFALYKLVYYENLDGFYMNLLKLSIATVVFLFISVMKLRRQKYASL